MSYQELKERGIFLPPSHQGDQDLRRPANPWALGGVGLVAMTCCVAMVLGEGRALTWIAAGAFLATLWTFTAFVIRAIERQNQRVDRVKTDDEGGTPT